MVVNRITRAIFWATLALVNCLGSLHADAPTRHVLAVAMAFCLLMVWAQGRKGREGNA